MVIKQKQDYIWLFPLGAYNYQKKQKQKHVEINFYIKH